MVITGKTLGLIRDMADKYITYCSHKHVSASDKKAAEKWDPLIKEAEDLLKAIDFSISQENNEPTSGQ